MSKSRIHWQWGAVCICIGSLLSSGCASRLALKDDTGQPIKRSEVEAKKKNNNFWLYTLGGGALSFGASFFTGAMVERGVDTDNRIALWSITGAGTVLGTLIFSHNGKVRDFNLAVEAVKDARQQELGKKIKGEQERQEKLAAERKRIEDERKRQEAERQKLLDQIRDQQKKKDQP